MKLSEIKPVGMLVTVCEAPFFDSAERFFYWDVAVPLKKDGVMQLETAKKLYTADQMQEYAKSKVKELLFEQLWNDRLYTNSKMFFEKEVEKICDELFKERQ